MRAIAVILHRWFGLTTAVFLFIAGATGAVISWDHELDEWLNPALYRTHTTGTAQSPLALAAAVERSDPRIQVTYLPLDIEPGHTLQMSVLPRVDHATGKLHEVNYSQVAVDPVTGYIQGTRLWGAVSLSRENLLPFLYKLHYSMHIPNVAGLEVGVLFMGIIAIVWVIDCLVALYLAFPKRTSWRKSFTFRWRQGGQKLNFDLHRSGGVWVWLFLLTLAITAVSMNLGTEVMRPLVSVFSPISKSPFDLRTELPAEHVPEPGITRQQAVAAAVQQAAARNWSAPPGAVFYSPTYQAYGVGFFAVDQEHGDGSLTKPKLGNPWLYVDAQDARLLFTSVPGSGSAGDVFIQAQFPLHSGRIIGVTGRVLVSLMGAVVAMLSVTGIVIWARRRRARLHSHNSIAANVARLGSVDVELRQG